VVWPLAQETIYAGRTLPVAVKSPTVPWTAGGTWARKQNWVTFTVESVDARGHQKFRGAGAGAFDLESSQMGRKRVGSRAVFVWQAAGRIKIIATVAHQGLAAAGRRRARRNHSMFMVGGAKMWSQDFGVPAEQRPRRMRPSRTLEAGELRCARKDAVV